MGHGASNWLRLAGAATRALRSLLHPLCAQELLPPALPLAMRHIQGLASVWPSGGGTTASCSHSSAHSRKTSQLSGAAATHPHFIPPAPTPPPCAPAPHWPAQTLGLLVPRVPRGSRWWVLIVAEDLEQRLQGDGRRNHLAQGRLSCGRRTVRLGDRRRALSFSLLHTHSHAARASCRLWAASLLCCPAQISQEERTAAAAHRHCTRRRPDQQQDWHSRGVCPCVFLCRIPIHITLLDEGRGALVEDTPTAMHTCSACGLRRRGAGSTRKATRSRPSGPCAPACHVIRPRCRWALYIRTRRPATVGAHCRHW